MEQNERREVTQDIITNIMITYHRRMDDYLSEISGKDVKETDVIILLMNILTNVASNIYYSIKKYIPDASFDFDFLKVKSLNSLAEEMDKIKDYKYEESLFKLNKEQLQEIFKNGHIVIKVDGINRKVTFDDLLMQKEDAEKYAEIIKNDTDTTKIVAQGSDAFQGQLQ